MYLVDSNIWLELLLEQERSKEVRQFLQIVEASELSLSEFTLYSIDIITTRLNREDVLEAFLSDILEDSGVRRICLTSSDLKQLISIRRKFRLDFDDAYQYVAAEKKGLILVSFDTDFDRTDLGRKTPAEIIAAGRTAWGSPLW